MARGDAVACALSRGCGGRIGWLRAVAGLRTRWTIRRRWP